MHLYCAGGFTGYSGASRLLADYHINEPNRDNFILHHQLYETSFHCLRINYKNRNETKCRGSRFSGRIYGLNVEVTPIGRS